MLIGDLVFSSLLLDSCCSVRYSYSYSSLIHKPDLDLMTTGM